MSIQTIQTDPAYASKEAERTFKAYWDARDFQDIVHEMTICIFYAPFTRTCRMCTGCTFRTFLADHPKGARSILMYAIQELRDERSNLYQWYETDLTGFGAHFAHNATFQVECSKYHELGEKVAMVPELGNPYKARNEYVWEFFAEMCSEELSRA